MAPINRTLTKILELNNTTTFKNLKVLNNAIHSHFCKTKTLQLSPMVSQLSLGQYSFQIDSFFFLISSFPIESFFFLISSFQIESFFFLISSFQIESFQTIMFFLMISSKDQFEEFQVSYK